MKRETKTGFILKKRFILKVIRFSKGVRDGPELSCWVFS